MGSHTPEEEAAFERCVDYLSFLIEKYADRIEIPTDKYKQKNSKTDTSLPISKSKKS